ncbi:MAG TPA: hypothetical protein VJ728_11200, partial [Candidatus Binataceae bacterium]|nr:hypothetical protein [Candidatus Binataceae bacterium]
MKVKCWVIAEPASDRPSLFEPLFANVAPKVRGGDDLHNVNGGSGTLLAIDFESLRALSPSALGALREQIKSGATCYVWGSLQADTQHSLEPLAPVSVRAQLEPQTASYLVVAKPPMPAVLQGETVIARSSVPVARGLSAIAQPLVLLRESDGSKASPLFEIEQGKGVIIC